MGLPQLRWHLRTWPPDRQRASPLTGPLSGQALADHWDVGAPNSARACGRKKAAISWATLTTLYTLTGGADEFEFLGALIEALVEEARAAGAMIENLVTVDSAAKDRRRPLRLVINAPVESAIARQEIFGQAMAIQAYNDVSECVARVNAGARPLALYYFGHDKEEQKYMLGHTLSGGNCVNDAMFQVGLSDVPFGGIGASGMSVYNGSEGFAESSHLRGVHHAGWRPPSHSLGLNRLFSNRLLMMMLKSVQRA